MFIYTLILHGGHTEKLSNVKPTTFALQLKVQSAVIKDFVINLKN